MTATEIKRPYHSLSRRIVLLFCLFTFGISATYSLISFALMYTLEDRFFEKEIAQEANYLTTEFQRTGSWPETKKNNFQLHFAKSTFPLDIRQRAIDEPLRVEFSGDNNRHYHIYQIPDFEDVYLVAEVSEQLVVRQIRSGTIRFLAISALIVSVIACFLAWLIGHKTAKPLKQLADLVDGVAPEQVPRRFAHQFPANEVGILAATLEQTFDRISQALARERLFTRDVSHELRTPLAVIKNTLELNAENATTQIGAAAEQMEKTVTTLLALAREEQANAVKEAVNLMPIIERSVLDNQILLANKDIEISVSDNCNIQIPAQSGMVKILLDNLLSNAFQYTQAGEVSVDFIDGCLIISDTGPGFDDAFASVVTQAGVKGSQSSGFGFGLSIVKRLCEHQGWTLTVQGTAGTSVSVRM